MKNSAKSTLKSVAAMSVISVVCVAILAFGNAFIPKYKPTLDLRTATMINEMLPTGLSSQSAFDEGYFEMLDLNEKKLAAFNKSNRAEPNNKVLAVYKVVKGEYSGYIVVEAQGQGYSGNAPISLLTAFDASAAVYDVTLKSQNENSPGTNGIFLKENFDRFREFVKGKTDVDAGSITAETGATSVYSVKGVANTVKISMKMAAALNENGGKL